jgi:hypothetical protein
MAGSLSNSKWRNWYSCCYTENPDMGGVCYLHTGVRIAGQVLQSAGQPYSQVEMTLTYQAQLIRLHRVASTILPWGF